jgi:hypothetical protein
MPKSTSAVPVLPDRIDAHTLARATGVKTQTVYSRVQHGALPPFDYPGSRTKFGFAAGWYAATIERLGADDPTLLLKVRRHLATLNQ